MWIIALSSTVARIDLDRALDRLRAVAHAAGLLLAGERGRLAPWLAVAMGAGVAAYFGLREEPPGWSLAAGPVLVALAILVAIRAPQAGWAIGLAGAAALGFGVAAWHAWRAAPLATPPSRAVVLSGIVQDVSLLPEGRRLTLAEVRFGPEEPVQPRSFRIRLRANDPARPEPGDRVTVRALVRPPSAPAFPGAWDFQRSAFFAGQGGAGFAIGPSAVEVAVGSGRPLSGVRAALEARVAAVVPGAAGAVAGALLTGGQSAIPRADLAAMRDSGLAHLLSVSGLHIAIVMGVTFWVVRLLIACWRWLALRVDGKACAGVAALVAGGFYMLLTGSQVPMQRSFATAVLVTLALLTGRQAVSMRSLALAAAAVMVVSPEALLGPSFQMSFAAVLALIAGWEALKGPMARLRGDGAWWRKGLVFAAGLVGHLGAGGAGHGALRPRAFRPAAMVRRGGQRDGGAVDLGAGHAGRDARRGADAGGARGSRPHRDGLGVRGCAGRRAGGRVLARRGADGPAAVGLGPRRRCLRDDLAVPVAMPLAMGGCAGAAAGPAEPGVASSARPVRVG